MKQRKYNNQNNYPKICHQAGYALVTSMLLLLMLATMGVSMYGNVNIQEQMAFNMQVKARTFIAADSLLQSNWTLGSLMKVRAEKEPVKWDEDDMYNQTTAGVTIDVDSNITICFDGEINKSIGFGTEASLHASHSGSNTVAKYQKFQLVANARDSVTNAETEIQQGGVMEMLAATKSPNC